MKTIGWIAVFIGVVNLICGKFLPGLSFGIVGALIVIYYTTSLTSKTINNTSNFNNIIGNEQFLSLAMDIKMVEKLIGADFSTWEQRDIIETVESFKRWANNQGGNILDVKEHFFKSFKETFAHYDIGELLPLLKTKEKEEALNFNIRERNTCTHYMVKWLNDAQILEQTKQEAKGKKQSEKMKVRNKKTARELIIEQNADIEIINNPNYNKLYFECGDIIGGISNAVSAIINEIKLEDLIYVEVAKPNTEDWVPFLMLNNKSHLANGIRTLGKDELYPKTSVTTPPISNDDLPF